MTNREYLDTLKICGKLREEDFKDEVKALNKSGIEIHRLGEFLRKDRKMDMGNVLKLCSYMTKKASNKYEYEHCEKLLIDAINSSQVRKVKGFKHSLDFESNLLSLLNDKKFECSSLETSLKLMKIVDVRWYDNFRLDDKRYRLWKEWAESDNCIYFSILNDDNHAVSDFGVMTLIKGNDMEHYRAGMYKQDELLKIGFEKEFDLMLVSRYGIMTEAARKMLEK